MASLEEARDDLQRFDRWSRSRRRYAWALIHTSAGGW
jgi:hypothetical protein